MPQTKDIPRDERHPLVFMVDDDVRDKLKERARKNHRTVSGEIRALLDEAVRNGDA